MRSRVPTAFQQPAPFIVGVPRSGTTLLRFMLDAHSQLAIPPETGFLPGLIEARPSSAEAIVKFVSCYPTWPDFGMSTQQLREAISISAHEQVNLAQAVRAFYGLYATRHGKQHWGDKTPNYLTRMTHISQLLPEARFVHIIRDGRDVAVSVRPLFFSPSSDIAGIAQDWVTRIRVARQAARKLPHYLEVMYEELVREPETVLGRICAFLELPYESSMLRYYQHVPERLTEHKSRINPDGSVLISHEQRVQNQRLTMQSPQESRIGRWRKVLTQSEIAVYQRVAGDLLEELGYSTK
jgi:hypothetical protein